MILRSTIDSVFEVARVEEVIGEFVTLKKAGSNFRGFSPFTDEQTPSFMVSPVKQIWKDFSTGKGGNVVSFLMEHEHFSYPAAIRYLAKKYNIEVEEQTQTSEEKKTADQREIMYLISDFAKDFFHDILLNNPKGKAIGLTYLEERGFKYETIKKFELGYSLDEWSAFTNVAVKKGYDIEYLSKTGLTIIKDNHKYFDRFKGRVLFPIQSMSGRVLGFGGRILTNDKKSAKYLNSPESEIYHKGKILYGIYQAKRAIAKENCCYLVEGYTDVISMSQAGIENVVAPLGTALTTVQISLIKRLTPNVIVLFDGDAAGIKASLRGIDLILEQGMNVRVTIFPEGDDPDSFSKKLSTKELKEYLENNTKDFINFKVSLLMHKTKGDPVKKAELVRDIVRSISKIPNSIQQEVYVKECSKMLDISEAVLFNELAQITTALEKKIQRVSSYTVDKHKEGTFQMKISDPQTGKENVTTLQEESALNNLEILEGEIIKILLLYGNKKVKFENWLEELNESGQVKMVKEEYSNNISQEVYLQLQGDEIEFTNQIFKKVYSELITKLNLEEEICTKELSNHHDLEIANCVTNILMDEEKYTLSNWQSRDVYVTSKEETLPKLVADAILNIRRILIEKKINELAEATISNSNNKEYVEMVRNYNHLKKKLFEKLHRIL